MNSSFRLLNALGNNRAAQYVGDTCSAAYNQIPSKEQAQQKAWYYIELARAAFASGSTTLISAVSEFSSRLHTAMEAYQQQIDPDFLAEPDGEGSQDDTPTP